MKELYSIGEVSKIKNISIKALRYYHKVGILIPTYTDEANGYRYYSIEQFVHIDIIKGCRALGSSIAELQDIFKAANTEQLLAFLQEKKAEAEQTIKEMQEVIYDIERLSCSVAEGASLIEQEDVVIKHYEQRYILVTPCQALGSLQELLYYSELDKLIAMQPNKMTLNRGMIYEIKENQNIKPRYVFNEIDTTHEVVPYEQMMVLPKGNYLTLAYRKENESKRISKILDYAKKHPFKMKYMMELELFNDLFNTDNYSCQIQIYLGDEPFFEKWNN